MSSTNPEQLTLNVNLRDGYIFESYYVEPEAANTEVVSVLQSIFVSKKPQQNIIWGEKSSGKTHLLQACCAKAADVHHTVSYIPLKFFKAYGTEVLEGLSQSKLLVIDDIDEVLGDKDWEVALFNLINVTRENGQSLLLSISENPRKLEGVLPDLASRLIWGGSYQLQALTDEEKPKALQARAEQRGFKLKDNVIEYVYRRYPRDIESLMEILNKLDEESFRQKALITIPFAKQILKDF
ncbi:MAG: DnaA regulatory inactivator Hda [Cocleimonas sp.]|nr:DnaA regulatory inactivator Hda [Cocleimonas sp.]